MEHAPVQASVAQSSPEEEIDTQQLHSSAHPASSATKHAGLAALAMAADRSEAVQAVEDTHHHPATAYHGDFGSSPTKDANSALLNSQCAQSFDSCFGNSIVSQASSPGKDDIEPGGAPLIDMAEAELIALLSEEGVEGLRRLTPRTLEACAEEGIEPVELLPRKLADFAPTDKGTELAPHHQQARLDRFEVRRIAKLSDVITTRRRLAGDKSWLSQIDMLDGAIDMSTFVEERRKQMAKLELVHGRQTRAMEEKRQKAESAADEAARRSTEVEKRMLEREQAHEAARHARNTTEAQKREQINERVAIRKAESAAAWEQRQSDSAAFELRRAAQLSASRSAVELSLGEKSRLRMNKAQAAQAQKDETIRLRTEQIRKLVEGRQKKVAEHEMHVEEKRQKMVKEAIVRQQKIDAAVNEVDRLQGVAAEQTLKRIEAKGKGNVVRDKLMAHRQHMQVEHAKVVAGAKEKVLTARAQAIKDILQTGERKELRRQEALAARADSRADELEARRAKLAEFDERMLRLARQREHQEDKKRSELEVKDAKFWANRAAIEKMKQEREAVRYKMAADAIMANGVRPTMKEIENRSEAGPTSYDNRFYQMGQLGPGGKYARVGTKKAPPAFSMGGRPKILEDLQVPIGPGPNSATQELASRTHLDKTNRYRRSPSWSLGHRLADPLNKEALGKPGPGDAAASDRQMQLTRYKSAPSFSFASVTYKELYRQSVKQAKNKTAGRPDSAPPTRLSYTHPARTPGPTTYNHGSVQTSLRHHRNLSDGVGVSQRFARANRFMPIDTNIKDETGPAKYTLERPEDFTRPGPQKYRPYENGFLGRSGLSF